jgi:hypothetical protein
MISTDVLNRVLEVTQVTNTTPFSHVVQQFKKHFSKQEYIRITLLLQMMLEDEVISAELERYVAYYLLYYIFQQQLPAITPTTVSVLFDQLQKKSKSFRSQQLFILKLVSDQITEVRVQPFLLTT